MSVSLRKIDGVESVSVSLQKASVDIVLKTDNKVTLPYIRRIIRSSGYPTKHADITARGRIVVTSGTSIFDLLNGSTLPIVERPKGATDGVVEITGVSEADEKNEEQLTIKAIKYRGLPTSSPSASPGGGWRTFVSVTVSPPLLPLTLTTLGVVSGDIGTSPLDAIRECFHGSHAAPATEANVLGVLSLITDSLVPCTS